MNKYTLRMALAMTAALAMPALAQDEAPAVTLNVDAGSVMVSDGGEFVTAANGSTLQPGTRVMVAEGSSATLGYVDGCSKSLATPGVYTVTPDCVPAAQGSGPGTGLVVGGVVAGAAVIAAAAGGGSDDNDPPPVSR